MPTFISLMEAGGIKFDGSSTDREFAHNWTQRVWRDSSTWKAYIKPAYDEEYHNRSFKRSKVVLRIKLV